mmetsp:Transcript_7022/g.7887  ORF Transcript_7022/g.7887 Transcript_7022/m.7887 type:complete len:204 (-) Transcript_7022:45-656(-)
MSKGSTAQKVEGVTENSKTQETEEKMPVLENQPKQEKKLNKAEKKCVKALNKMGMKNTGGITRVTLKRRDGIIFVISSPEVYKSPTSENSFVVVGELKMDEPKVDTMPQMPAKTAPTTTVEGTTKAKADTPAKAAPAASKEEEKAAPAKEADDDEELDESSLTPMHIDMVMNNAGCTRPEAVKALVASNNDMVNAIMYLTKQH